MWRSGSDNKLRHLEKKESRGGFLWDDRVVSFRLPRFEKQLTNAPVERLFKTAQY